MAVTVLGRSALTPGLREIGADEGFPGVARGRSALYRAAGRNLAAIDALYNYLESYLRPRIPADLRSPPRRRTPRPGQRYPRPRK